MQQFSPQILTAVSSIRIQENPAVTEVGTCCFYSPSTVQHLHTSWNGCNLQTEEFLLVGRAWERSRVIRLQLQSSFSHDFFPFVRTPVALSLFCSQRMSFDKGAGSDASFQHFLLFSHVVPCFYLLLGCVTVLRHFRLFHSCRAAKGEIRL